MSTEFQPPLLYQRGNFTTHLPCGYRYSSSHFWADDVGGGLWKIGFTKFATRMLGETVDHGFEAEVGAAVIPGQVVGWIEGFKALTELFCIARGEFAGGNPALREDAGVISRDPYGEGWLYRVQGEPDLHCVDVNGYREMLDATIDRILERQSAS